MSNPFNPCVYSCHGRPQWNQETSKALQMDHYAPQMATRTMQLSQETSKALKVDPHEMQWTLGTSRRLSIA